MCVLLLSPMDDNVSVLDLPFWDYTFAEPQLIVPYSYDCNDARFSWENNFPDGQSYFNYLRDTFDLLYEEGLTAPKCVFSC